MTVRRLALVVFCALLVGAPWSAALAEPGKDVPLLDRIGLNRGICILLGDRECESALELARSSELTVFVQLTGEQDVAAARRIVDEAGLYGTRIYVERGDLKRIHFGDNLADAVVAQGEAL